MLACISHIYCCCRAYLTWRCPFLDRVSSGGGCHDTRSGWTSTGKADHRWRFPPRSFRLLDGSLL